MCELIWFITAWDLLQARLVGKGLKVFMVCRYTSWCQEFNHSYIYRNYIYILIHSGYGKTRLTKWRKVYTTQIHPEAEKPDKSIRVCDPYENITLKLKDLKQQDTLMWLRISGEYYDVHTTEAKKVWFLIFPSYFPFQMKEITEKY